MNNYHKNKESSYLKCWCVNNLYGWAMSQKLPAKNCKEDSDFTMTIFTMTIFTMIYHFHLKKWKLKKLNNL